MTTVTEQTLPILDLAKLQDPATADEFLRELRRATGEFGFFYLVGHGVPDDLQAEIVEVARQFFALPAEQKDAIDKLNSPHYRGYSRLGNEITRGRRDEREQIDIASERSPLTDEHADWATLVGPNQWPEALPELRSVVERWRSELELVARRLLGAWLVALGQRTDLLDDIYDPPNELIKIVRYPAAKSGESTQGVGAHKDGGVLTLLFVEPGKGGLQVEKDGEWIDAPTVDGAFIVNIGEMLEVATDGVLKATVHRVVSREDEGDRISVPYFFNPNYDTVFPTFELPSAYDGLRRGITQDPLNPIHPTYGFNVLKSRLRSHPDVAERHHPHLIGKY